MHQNIPLVKNKTVSSITIEQMIEVDRLMIEEYHINLIQMMENAGRNLARLAMLRFVKNEARVIVLCGTGGNGGGGLVCARHLSNRGISVQVCLNREWTDYKGVPGHQLRILRKMGIPFIKPAALTSQSEVNLVIDAIIGYSLAGNPRGNALQMINWANRQTAFVLSLDIPSGIEGTDGTVTDPSIYADATMTLALPKAGLLSEKVVENVGELFLADISVPPQLYKKAFGFKMDRLFAESEILEIV